ncbi:hypothetical protein [Arcticibacterium luteifluviistationis]|uniref:Uncharacterized protein n=1 Tax=Arcticibacterium luteifluviistationis TaxID=1784714 RepID=A0A2Z4GAG1_9BACT|nr:hypothetical protein [Arcticibacterium luteifluviistationis]AWV98249.1 hypothetical protein DJ013_08740 [Arcticibacterium luteifluviistationis]
MELKISGISDRGVLEDERIGFKVIKDCELKFYQLFRTSFRKAGGFYNRAKSAYWFAPKIVKAGDKIVVYSKSGTDNSKENPDGTTTYWIYWGLDEPIFTDEKYGIVLVQVYDWELSKNK